MWGKLQLEAPTFEIHHLHQRLDYNLDYFLGAVLKSPASNSAFSLEESLYSYYLWALGQVSKHGVSGSST